MLMVANPADPPVRYHAAKLNHLGMLYAGSIAEVAQGRPIFGLPHDHPGLPMVRDLLQLVLFTRAELNAVTKLLRVQGVTDQEIESAIAEEYEWLTAEKARQFGVRVTDLGIEVEVPRRPGDGR
jgi:hypothetical protein